MIINWLAFVVVVVAALVSAGVVVTLFAVALRLGDGQAAWRRPVSIALYVLCALAVLYGLYLIVPALHRG
jgi:uncharacterized membrane protein